MSANGNALWPNSQVHSKNLRPRAPSFPFSISHLRPRAYGKAGEHFCPIPDIAFWRAYGKATLAGGFSVFRGMPQGRPSYLVNRIRQTISMSSGPSL